jgi:pimeloyl-ACP methyl ester carboxylesterase
MQITPFTIAIPDTALTDLRERLARARWPDEINDDAWEWGTRADTLRRFVDRWANGYDWRIHEAALNRLPQFRAEIDGLHIHFVHIRGKGPNPHPLIITHGWPGSFIEMRGIIPLLTDPAAHGGDPADAFDVVVPSLPGYGFSDAPASPGISPRAVAPMWVKLMQGLGYSRFGLQGGDWGAIVSTALAMQHPDVVSGFHLNFLAGGFPPPASDAPAEEKAYFAARANWYETEGAYGHEHGTKPQTLAYALMDSPVGLAAWILEKIRTWSDCHGDPGAVIPIDDVLTNISIYWLTGTIGSSIRLYKEMRRDPLRFNAASPVTPPLAFAQFPVEIPCPPRRLAERFFNVRQWTVMPRGGHFAAWEQPALLAEDVRKFFRTVR